MVTVVNDTIGATTTASWMLEFPSTRMQFKITISTTIVTTTTAIARKIRSCEA